jgi:alpha-glucosidase
MKIWKILIVLPFFSQIGIAQTGNNNIAVVSPDGRTQVNFMIDKGKAFYCLSKDQKPIILKSGLGFQFANLPDLDKDFAVVKTETNTLNETWEQPWGEKRFIVNHYNELVIHLQELSKLQRKLDIIFRVFNDGIGFRYYFPQQAAIDSFQISNEETEFTMAAVHKAWWIPVHSDNSNYESIFRHTAINKMDTANTPLTLETKDGMFLTIHEANLTDYASMTLLCKDSTRLTCELVPWSTGIKVYGKAPFSTPWRTVIIADKPGDLITSYLMLNLNEPCKIKDLSWIKPSKYIGIWWGMHLGKYTWSQGPKHGATTDNTLKYIDFAAANGFDGVLVEGWNEGWDGNWYENGKIFSFTKPYPDFDLEKICQYAASKKVKLIGHHETGGSALNYENQMDEAFALYRKNGVDVVKTGYVNKFIDGKEWHDSQYAIRHYRKVVETAAKYHIMIVNHEPVKPTGLLRTYPNFMSQEGARGQEYDAWSPDGGNPPSHTTILPFTRMLAGPLDFTPGTFNFSNPANPKNRVQTTLAKQLALYLIIYTPVQMASDLPENYINNNAFNFIKIVPTDWDDTKVLNGEIGAFVTIARKDRKSDDWYLGSITNEEKRDLTIDLSFLDKGQDYLAQIYADGENANWKSNPTDIKIEEKIVNSSSSLVLKLASGGGQAIRFTKKTVH